MSVRRSSAAVLGLLSSVRGLEVGGVDPVGDSSPVAWETVTRLRFSFALWSLEYLCGPWE